MNRSLHDMVEVTPSLHPKIWSGVEVGAAIEVADADSVLGIINCGNMDDTSGTLTLHFYYSKDEGATFARVPLTDMEPVEVKTGNTANITADGSGFAELILDNESGDDEEKWTFGYINKHATHLRVDIGAVAGTFGAGATVGANVVAHRLRFAGRGPMNLKTGAGPSQW